MYETDATIAWAKTKDIIIPENILKKIRIRGIYGLFVDDKCIYVGKSENIYKRLFASDKNSGGHLYKLKYKIDHQEKLYGHLEVLKNAIDQKQKIEVKVLKEVPHQDDNPYKNAQRLASAECFYIDYYQNIDQCLHQMPEGVAFPKTTHK